MDLKLHKCLATGTSKCSAGFEVLCIRNAKDIAKRSTHWLLSLAAGHSPSHAAN